MLWQREAFVREVSDSCASWKWGGSPNQQKPYLLTWFGTLRSDVFKFGILGICVVA